MLDLEVTPGQSIQADQWELHLGMAFSQVVHILQQQFQAVKNVQVQYSELNPLVMDLIINLTQDGIRFLFDPLSQRLKVIEVYNMSKCKLKYCGNVFCSPEVPPTIHVINNSFGATFPGDFQEQLFILNYRGVSFSFTFDPSVNIQDLKEKMSFAHGMSSVNFGAHPPIVSKMSIYSGNSLAETKAPGMPESTFCNHCYLESLDVLREGDRTLGIKLTLNTEDLSSNQIGSRNQIMTKTVHFGDSAQDVSRCLGSPSKVFYKSEDKMKIHSPHPHRYRNCSSDYFYNYFTLGLDVLFDARSHRVKKLVLHTNFPGHYNFNMYFRCHFRLPVDLAPPMPSPLRLVDVAPNRHLVTPFTKWDSLEELVSPVEKPVVLSRASTHNATNPFGATCCHGYQDIIFEVMPNKHLASVTLFQRKRPVVRHMEG